MSESDDGMVAKGTLADRPLGRLLWFLHVRGLTGHLGLVDDSGDKSVVFFRQGFPVHVDRGAANQIDRLDRVLADSGAIPPDKLAAAEEARAQTGRRLGDVLEQMGALPEEALSEGLKLQLRRKLTRLFFLQRARFDAFKADHLHGTGTDLADTRMDVRELVHAGIRAGYDEERLDRELGVVFGKQLKLNADAERVALDLGDAERSLWGALAEGERLENIVKHGGRLADLKALVLALLYTDLLEIRAGGSSSASTRPAGSRPPPPAPSRSGAAPPGWLPPRRRTPFGGSQRVRGGTDPRIAAPPPGTEPRIPAHEAGTDPSIPRSLYQPSAPGTPARAATVTTPLHLPGRRTGPTPGSGSTAVGDRLGPAELRVLIVDTASRLDKMNHFEVLGIGDKATPAEVNVAYLRAVKQYHPDRLRGMGLGDLRAEAERIMARASEANTTLSDPKGRADYVKTMRFSDADRRKALAALDAELAFQKGETFLKKGDLARADAAFEEAVKGNPDEPEHKAMLAWTRFMAPGAHKDRAAADAIPIIEDATRQRPRFARGHYFLGEIWKHRKDLKRATESFTEALAIDPNHAEAMRELRLIQMRQKGGASPPPSTGLLGKFLKR